MLSLFASTIPGFSEISAGLKPQSSASPQDLSILQQLALWEASKFLEYKNYEGTQLLKLDGKGPNNRLAVDEPRFLQDYLDKLLKLELLTISFKGSGERVFHYTRAAHDIFQGKVTKPSDIEKPSVWLGFPLRKSVVEIVVVRQLLFLIIPAEAFPKIVQFVPSHTTCALESRQRYSRGSCKLANHAVPETRRHAWECRLPKAHHITNCVFIWILT
jgi:hypothetical protein